MYKSILLILGLVASTALAQQRTTPVPILRQINTHNDDGSYTYGYENGDGSYKIENKAANGEVSGKYGYYDDRGTLREIEYGASKNGFNPSGTGIQVPAPVITNNQFGNSEDYDDGQYRPGPGEKSYRGPAVVAAPAPVTRSRPAARPAARPNARTLFSSQQAPAYQQPQQQQNYYQPQTYQPVQIPAHIFKGHPATNINLNSGSYSIQY